MKLFSQDLSFQNNQRLQQLLPLLLPLLLLSLLQSCASKTEKPAAKESISTADTATISALITKASSFSQVNFDSMHYYSALALEKAKAIGFTVGIAKAKGLEANFQRRRGNYAEGATLALEAIHTYDSLHRWPELVSMKNQLADLYKEMGGEKQTVAYQQKALEIAREGQLIGEREKYFPGVIGSLNMQGIILRDMSQTSSRPDLMDSAFLLYQKGISIIKSTGQGEEQLGKLYNNISQVYNEHLKDYKKALEYQMMAVDFNSKRNNQLPLTYNYNNIAYIYSNLNDMEAANLYANKMVALGKQLKAPFRLVNAYGLMTDINKKMGRYDSALYYYQLGVNISDSINNLEKTSQIAEVQTRYETTKKEERINYLDGLTQLRSRQLWILIGAVGLLLLLFVIVWRQKTRLQKQQAQIREQSEKLQWMMKELHHRVKNNLQIVSSLLNLQTYRLKDEETIAAVRESQLRVQAMSLMHQRLYQVADVSMVNFRLYLTDLLETLMKAYGYETDDFDLQIHIEEEMLDVDTVMPMGLLANEIITNAFKYAYKDIARPTLIVRLQKTGNQLHLQMADNGPGMNSNTTSGGFGQQLIKALTKQLKASCSIDTASGTRYDFNIPYQQKKTA